MKNQDIQLEKMVTIYGSSAVYMICNQDRLERGVVCLMSYLGQVVKDESIENLRPVHHEPSFIQKLILHTGRFVDSQRYYVMNDGEYFIGLRDGKMCFETSDRIAKCFEYCHAKSVFDIDCSLKIVNRNDIETYLKNLK